MVKFLACLLLICKVAWYRQENDSFRLFRYKQEKVILQNDSVRLFRYKREKEVVEKDLSLLKQELEEIKKEASGPRSPTRSVFLSYNTLLQHSVMLQL